MSQSALPICVWKGEYANHSIRSTVANAKTATPGTTAHVSLTRGICLDDILCVTHVFLSLFDYANGLPLKTEIKEGNTGLAVDFCPKA